jgi:hypothetical protein
VDEIQVRLADQVLRLLRADELCSRRVNVENLLFVEDTDRVGEVFYQSAIALLVLLEGSSASSCPPSACSPSLDED